MNSQIRSLESHELKALLALYAHLHAVDDPLPGPEQVEAVWQEILSNPRLSYWGVWEGPALVASCTLAIIPNLTRACRPYGVIENVVTHADHRRQGHGQKLLSQALAQAWTAGCYKVMLLTGRDESTCRFYESAGFDRRGKQAFVARPPG